MTRTRKTVDDRSPRRQVENLPPGSRATQRGTESQIQDDPHPARPDEPTAWERELQEELPPRGEGSQQNQGEDRMQETVASVGDRDADDRAAGEPEMVGALQTGGPRAPSKEPGS
jgi:hypothetical protein